MKKLVKKKLLEKCTDSAFYDLFPKSIKSDK